MPLQGAMTGYYRNNTIYVNVPVTAIPTENPKMKRWSYPGYKVDRTACGVVAHELGHHVEIVLRNKEILTMLQGSFWRDILNGSVKRVSGYEPVPSEAFAESMRLFILNPELLKF